MKKMVLLTLLTLAPMSALAGDITGFVNTVNVNKHPLWNGVLVQLVSGGQPIVVDAACGNSSWAFFRLIDNVDKAMLATLLAAKASNTLVRVATQDCIAPPVTAGTVPLIQWIDLDIRK